MGLGEISRTVLALERQNRIIADREKPEYNKAENKSERSFENERADIHNAGRLQSSRLDNAQAAGSDFGQVRSDETEISQGTPQIRYYNLLTSCTLTQHLVETEQTAMKLEETLMKQMTAQEGLTESLKAADMMKWVQGMNNLRNRVQEIVKAEIIFA